MGDSTKNNNDKLEIDDAALMMNMEKRTDATSVEIKEIKKYEEVKGGLSAGQVSTSALPLKQQSMAVIPVDTKKKNYKKSGKTKATSSNSSDRQASESEEKLVWTENQPTNVKGFSLSYSLSLSLSLSRTHCMHIILFLYELFQQQQQQQHIHTYTGVSNSSHNCYWW
jgi:hypothetical protein